MDLHERYLHVSTIDFSVFNALETTFNNDPFLFLHQAVKYYNDEIIKNDLSREQLSTFRMILCYEYQLTFSSEKKLSRIIANDLCFKNIENSLLMRKRSQNISEHPIIGDIIILQLVLYCNPQCIEQHLFNFQKYDCCLSNSEHKVFYMKMLECFLESLQLRKLVCNDLGTNVLEYFHQLCLKDMLLWLQTKENKEWQLFASILPKMIDMFGIDNVLPTIWNCIINKLDDLKDILCGLSISIDISFSLKLENTSFIYNTLCCSEQLWLLITQGLKSSIQQYRKQALCIMKHVTHFMSNIGNISLMSEKSSIVPFICIQLNKTKISINDIKEKYFLILEALEEKQHHLILPALTHLPILVKGSKEHAVCNDCFSNIWLQLIFERMLQHENYTIVKQGILYVCEFPTIVYDREFLKLFVHVLNTTSLYECQVYQEYPEILNNIELLIIQAKEQQDDFLNIFIETINEETWAPIPLFYVMKVLRTAASKVSNQWENKQLILVKSLVQKNLNMHSLILRIASQIELLKTISISASKISDLKIVLDMLLEFSSKETILRKSFAWSTVITWLKRILLKEEAVNFVRLACKEYSCQEPQTKVNATKFALAIVILHDADLILQSEKCPVQEILNNWLFFLKGVDSRSYANTTQILFTIEFMSHLLNLSTTGSIRAIIQLLNTYINDALIFLLKNTKSIPYKCNYEEISRCLTAIDILLKNGGLILSEREILHYTKKFKDESIAILEKIKQYTSMHYMFSLDILHCTQNILCPNHTTLYLQPLLNICDIHISNNDGEEVTFKGKVASKCYVLLAKLLNQFFSMVEMELWSQEVNWFSNISHLYEMGGNEIVPKVALLLKTIVDKGVLKNPDNISSLESFFTLCWRTTLLSTKNKIYFSAIKNLLGVIINNNFLVLPNSVVFVNNFIEQLLEEASNVPKLKKILLTEMRSLSIPCLKKLHEPLLSCLLHGYAFGKDKHIENQAYLYITKHYQHCYPQHMQIIDHNMDGSIRATSVALLCKIINEDKGYGSILLPIILQNLEKYKTKRYFNHSYIHKIKHRLMQTLLIIQPILSKNENVLLQEFLCNLVLVESNQHSVRIMQEWLLINIFTENVELHNNLWEFFEKGITIRPGCASSVICIVYHVAKLLSKNSQSDFIIVALNYIARCCLGQQYSMRLHSQIILVKLYEMVEAVNCQHVLLQYKGLYDAAILNLKDGLAKNSNKIQEDFYLSAFHAVEHYSLQTIYFELPRLTNMDTSEWIEPHLFKTVNFSEISGHPLKLYNLDTSLSDTKTSSYLKGEIKSHVGENCADTELNDIQKKLIPLMTNLSYGEIFPTIRECISHRKSLLEEEGLIVVACLVSRTPNLGGLARTCEIFNVKELVVGNLSQIKDKEFQNLSVSAENWINITETKPHELCKYLLNKKEMGWSLIGVEQTANSTNLLNMKFDRKTILILGNEKEGIPANLIPLFDSCIQIPQIGVIRSLNVHVSGAICIWQYAKQHILT